MSYPLNDGRYTGAGEEIRTLDILLGRQMLYQLSYARIQLEQIVGFEPTASTLATLRSTS